MKIRHQAGRPMQPLHPLKPLLLGLLAAAQLGAAGFAQAEEAKPEEPVAKPSVEDKPAKLAPVAVIGNRVQAGRLQISGEELSKVAGSGGDPVRALQSLPGVVATSDGNAAPAIRGSRPGDNSY